MAKSARQLDTLTMVLIGSLGCGKSSTGNSILGKKKFKSRVATIPITTKVETESVLRGNLSIRVVDTPGLQSSSDFPKLNDDIKRCLKDCQTGIIRYALVIQIGRYTTEERQVIEDIFKKNKILQKDTIIIFTNKKDLENDQTIDDWIKKNPSLSVLIDLYKLKYRAFENKWQEEEENNKQVRDLISDISEEDQPTTFLPVSDRKKKKQNFIYVSRELMGKTFGTCGLEFFDDQLTIQKNVDDYKMQ